MRMMRIADYLRLLFNNIVNAGTAIRIPNPNALFKLINVWSEI